MTDHTIVVRNVSKAYEGHVAIRELSLTVPRATVYGLLGPNGAGKTTTIRMILNIIVPDTGSVEVLGQPAGRHDLGDRIGYLPEERGLYRKMRVQHVLRYVGALKGVRRRDADHRIAEWAERLGLSSAGGKDWTGARVEELSRGMQQKVQFIAALLHDPDLVILDEPFSGLDPVNAQALKDTVIDLKRRGKTVIFSTHMMDNAERMCDAVCIIARGEKVLDGTVREVKGGGRSRHIALALDGGSPGIAVSVLQASPLVARVDDQNRFFEIELAPDAEPQALLRELVQADIRVQRFELVQPSLHNIFLQRVGAVGVEEGLSGQG